MSMREPAGSSTDTSTAPVGPMNRRSFVLIVRTPPEQETSVCSGGPHVPVPLRVGGPHLDDRVESVPAVNRMEPAPTWAVTAMGSGVSKRGMAVPSS